MKKITAILLILALCLGLCACGGKDIELPTRPVQAAAPNQSAAVPQSSTDAAEESTEAIDPTGETYPWETEFNGEDYISFEMEAPNGDKFVTWREGSIFGTERRNLYEWPDGNIEDSYYYPSGNCSHSYMWYTNGSYQEHHYLDNSYIEDGVTHMGTVVYFKQVNPDGTWNETHCDENGNVTYSASLSADGIYWESRSFEDGTRKDVSDDPNTGVHSESEYYANGNIKRSVYKDAAGNYTEGEYYENGNLKYMKNQSPEYTSEERCDEEGFRTYFYSKNADYEIELTADESGKLVKVIENGTEVQDPAIIAQYARDYNFKE